MPDDKSGTPQAASSPTPSWRSATTISTASPTAVTANPTRAREMFSYAASYFGDPEASTISAASISTATARTRDPRQAARWLGLAANKGQYQAQALLGAMLFKGEDVPRQAALGLIWLTLAKDGAGADETWITELYASAFAQATDDERTMALNYLESGSRACE